MKNITLVIIAFIGMLMGGGVFFNPFVYAQVLPQDVEKATRETDRPIRQEVEEKLKRPPEKLPEIKEEEEELPPEGPTFFIKTIRLDGVESLSPDEFKPITGQYEDREVTLEELEILAKKIEREYLRKGITLEDLDKIADAYSHNGFARLMQDAKEKLFKKVLPKGAKTFKNGGLAKKITTESRRSISASSLD